MAKDLPVMRSLEDVVALVERHPGVLHVRFGTVDDGPSCDHLSGLDLPGLSVNPVTPPGWWRDRPLVDWVARQLRTYAHLETGDGDKRCLLLTGTIADRGPDNEPLLTDPEYLAEVDRAVVELCRAEADDSPRPEDAATGDGAAPWQATENDRQ